MENKKKRRVIWALTISLFSLPLAFGGLVYLDYQLSYQRPYCVYRSILLLKLPNNVSENTAYGGSARKVYNCSVRESSISQELFDEVVKNYKYDMDLEKPLKYKQDAKVNLPNFSEKYLKKTKEPWSYKLENGIELPEYSNECNAISDKRKCVVVKFHTMRKSGASYDAYFHYLILVKDSDSIYKPVAESFENSSLLKG
jgi:hypothetical protein